MLNNRGLVLEGGAFRSVFSGGVLDFFLEHDFYVPNIITLSAGAYAALNYVSRQPQRLIRTNIDPLRKKKYLGLGYFFRTGNLFDFDFLFERMPNELEPFDYDAFFTSGQKLVMSATNCATGKAAYFDDYQNKERLMDICRASNSFPFIARIVDIDGEPMLDGGMCDAIPIEKALADGNEKIIVVFTRTKEYRKKSRWFYLLMIRLFYRKYPNFVEAVKQRSDRYNYTLDLIDKLEQEGKVYIIRPSERPVSNYETNPDRLLKFYEHGYMTAKEKFQEIKDFVTEAVKEAGEKGSLC
ncbi:MAG: patatin family protein [Lachnospiraceae bacterium]|jgi:predicted patatin/cPLA2 family phospholipase|nr:patatin family protein [Lachnospiraceae bacterium]